MNEYGRSALPTDIDGRILDRLAGLEKIIMPDVVRKVIWDSGKRNNAGCKLTHEVMMWVVLAMGLFTELPIRQVFKACQSLSPASPR